MRKFFDKLGNIPTLIVVGVLAVVPMIVYEINAVMHGDFYYFPLDICLIILYGALATFAIMKNKVATLGLFTVLLGAYLIGCTSSGIFEIMDGVNAIKANEDFGAIHILTGLVNAFFAIGIIIFVIGKYFLTGNKTVLINIMLTCFCLTVIGNIVVFIMCFPADFYVGSNGSIDVISVIYGFGQIFAPFLFLCTGSIAESLNK